MYDDPGQTGLRHPCGQLDVDQVIPEHTEAVPACGTLPGQHGPFGQAEQQGTQFVIVAAGLVGVNPPTHSQQFLTIELATDPPHRELLA